MPSTRSLLLGFGAAVATFAQQQTEYDYVICGGGTAGLVIANRLSEAQYSVLVVEAGANGTVIPWEYKTTPQTYIGGRVLDLRSGKAIGGTSQLNGMVYARPDAESIDDWGRINNAGWSWNTLLPFYKMSETLDTPDARLASAGFTYNPTYHGTNGPLNVSFPAQGIPEYFDILKQTAAALDIETTRDFNGGQAEGLAGYPMTVRIPGEREQFRESSYEAYYLPTIGRPNLEMLDQTSCLRLVFGNSTTGDTVTASGVEISNANTRTTVTARKEVILSAGVYRSSGILEHSGIGNSQILSKYNIATVVDLPGVGENLQDQMQGNFVYRRANTSNITFPVPIGPEITTNYVIHATYEQIFGASAGDFQERTNSSLPDLADKISKRITTLSPEQILNSLRVQYDAVFTSRVPAVEIFSGQFLGKETINFEFWPLIPLGRGSAHISGGSPEQAGAHPIVDVNWGIADHDWEIFIAAGRFVRNFFRTGPLANEVTEETEPGLSALPEDASDAEWKEWWQESFRVGWHGIGTAAMLPLAWGGVVNGNLTVYGTSNVRVIDASVIPFQLGGHPTATIYALAERAASLIINDLSG